MPILVVLPPAVIACGSDSVGEAWIIRHDCAGIAEGSEVLCRIEAEATSMRKTAGLLAIPARAMRLCRIFDHVDASLRRYPVDRYHIGRLAIQVDYHDGCCPACYSPLYALSRHQ